MGAPNGEVEGRMKPRSNSSVHGVQQAGPQTVDKWQSEEGWFLVLALFGGLLREKEGGPAVSLTIHHGTPAADPPTQMVCCCEKRGKN